MAISCKICTALAMGHRHAHDLAGRQLIASVLGGDNDRPVCPETGDARGHRLRLAARIQPLDWHVVVYFEAEEDRTSGRSLASAKLIPDRGAWMEFETRKSDYITIKFNRKRTVLRFFGVELPADLDGRPVFDRDLTPRR